MIQKLMYYYSKHIERVRSQASPIIFLEERLTCFQDYMNTRQQDYISELSQHEQNAFKKRSQASEVKEWSEEKKKARNKEKLYAQWCEIAAQVLQQDAANTLMRSLSSLQTLPDGLFGDASDSIMQSRSVPALTTGRRLC